MLAFMKYKQLTAEILWEAIQKDFQPLEEEGVSFAEFERRLGVTGLREINPDRKGSLPTRPADKLPNLINKLSTDFSDYGYYKNNDNSHKVSNFQKKQLPIGKNLINMQQKSQVPVVGYIGAGQVVYITDELQGGMSEMVSLPKNLEGKVDLQNIYALEVEPESIAPFEESMMLFYSKIDLQPDARGLHVVKILNGATHLRYIEPGSEPGTFNLWYGDTRKRYNQQLEWIGRFEGLARKS